MKSEMKIFIFYQCLFPLRLFPLSTACMMLN